MGVGKLSVNGGLKTRAKPWPGRHLIGVEEKEEIIRLFDGAIKTGNPIGYNGKEEEEYCQKFAEYLGGGYADAVNSGTNALYIALHALNIEPFTEIIVGAVTDPGGVMPIPLLNCIPVIADTAPEEDLLAIQMLRCLWIKLITLLNI